MEVSRVSFSKESNLHDLPYEWIAKVHDTL